MRGAGGFKVRRVELRLLGGVPTCVAYYFSNELSQGHQVVGVFSAMFAVTDRLLAAVASAEAADEEGVLRARREIWDLHCARCMTARRRTDVSRTTSALSCHRAIKWWASSAQCLR